jgi:putative membrane protein
LLVLIPFGIGMVLGIVLISRLFEYLFKKYEIPTYFAIIGFVLSSVIGIFLTVDNLVFNPLTIGIGLITLIIGFVIAYRLEEK